MNLQLLFTTSRVITAVYRIASTSLLLYYLAQRLKEGRRDHRATRRAGRIYRRFGHDEEIE